MVGGSGPSMRCSPWVACAEGNQPVNKEACEGSDQVDGATARVNSAELAASFVNSGVVSRS
jgi:hypothetical protein